MSDSTLDRRSFLRRSGMAAGAAVASQPLLSLMAQTAAGARPKAPSATGGGYGPLATVTGGGDLKLPAGFTAVKFGETGTPLTNGGATPTRHDGMGCFPTRNPNVVRLVRNHEVDENNDPAEGFAMSARQAPYNVEAPGGTTTMEFHLRSGRLRRSWASLTGTNNNCAGGVTPWGSWLTCEEFAITRTYDSGETFTHGYVFEVPAGADGQVAAVPLKAMGAFYHEAVAVDPATGIVYQTEDRGTSGFYRFVPTRRGDLSAGRLQMLAVNAQPGYDTRTGQTPGATLDVSWVDIEDPDPAGYGVDGNLQVYSQGLARGGATFARLEGAWEHDRFVYIVSTSGGDEGLGQVWEHDPRRDTLRLVFESPGADVLDSPDNITVSPNGALLLCEDGGGDQYLRGVTVEGDIFDFGMNVGSGSEFAGACWSPDGSTLFVNIQSGVADTPVGGGASYAITGPWRNGAL